MYKHLLYVEYILLVVYNAIEYPDRIQNQNYNCLLNFQILNIYFRFTLQLVENEVYFKYGCLYFEYMRNINRIKMALVTLAAWAHCSS